MSEKMGQRSHQADEFVITMTVFLFSQMPGAACRIWLQTREENWACTDDALSLQEKKQWLVKVMILCVLFTWLCAPICTVSCLQSIFWDILQNDIVTNIDIITAEFQVIHSLKIVNIIKPTFKVFHNFSKGPAHHTDLLQRTPLGTTQDSPPWQILLQTAAALPLLVLS